MTGISASIIYLFLALVVVLLIAWVVIRFLSGIYTQRVLNGEIQVSSTYSLGTRQQLFVVKFRDKDYLLGVTPENIQVIDSMPVQSSSEVSEVNAGDSEN